MRYDHSISPAGKLESQIQLLVPLAKTVTATKIDGIDGGLAALGFGPLNFISRGD